MEVSLCSKDEYPEAEVILDFCSQILNRFHSIILYLVRRQWKRDTANISKVIPSATVVRPLSGIQVPASVYRLSMYVKVIAQSGWKLNPLLLFTFVHIQANPFPIPCRHLQLCSEQNSYAIYLIKTLHQLCWLIAIITSRLKSTDSFEVCMNTTTLWTSA